MIAVHRALSLTEARLQAAFWRVAAAATGFAVHHPRTMRFAPVGLLAVTAFALGRAAAEAILRGF
jgi:hypothetical protein